MKGRLFAFLLTVIVAGVFTTQTFAQTSTGSGPPKTYSSRSDLKTAQLTDPPDLGNLTGANKVITDPDFNNHVVRITDAATNPAQPNFSFVATTSGSGDQNIWNTNSTLFVIADQGGWMYPFSFSPSTLQASRLYASSYPSTGGMTIASNSGSWSYVNTSLLYIMDLTTQSPVISSYDFTDLSTPPSAAPVYDFSASSHCLPNLSGNITWSSDLGTSGDDTVFGAGFSDAGDQGTGIYVAAYKVGAGCSWYDTSTQTVGGDWGSSGRTGLKYKFTIHNVRVSKDGNWLIITPASSSDTTSAADAKSTADAKSPADSTSTSIGYKYYWQIGTLTVNPCPLADDCGGHFTEGYTHWVNNSGAPPNQAAESIRLFSSPTIHTQLITDFPAVASPWDIHTSWNNAVSADDTPVLGASASATTPFPSAWYNEILGIATDGSGKVWRFAHSYITAQSEFFDAQWAIGSGSQDGHYYLFTSDWQGTLGSASGSDACTIGTDCRADVFVVELK